MAQGKGNRQTTKGGGVMDWTWGQVVNKIEQDEAMDKLEQAVEEMEAAKLNLEMILEGGNGSDYDLV